MIKLDIFGKEPKIGDIIVFNPPKYKGLSYGTIIDFTDAGCPKINNVVNGTYKTKWDIDHLGFYSVKTEFVIK